MEEGWIKWNIYGRGSVEFIFHSVFTDSFGAFVVQLLNFVFT
jgi:hypothetical protein